MHGEFQTILFTTTNYVADIPTINAIDFISTQLYLCVNCI